jgi:hypothetical protein
MSSYSVIDKDNSGLWKIFKDKQKAINAIMKLKDVYNMVEEEDIKISMHSNADKLRKKYGIKQEEEK